MPSHDLHKYIHRYYTALHNYSASQQTVSADGLQNNAQHRKMIGIKTAICAPSIRPDLCISSRGCSMTCRRVDDVGHETRHQVIPLALCWSITMHKSQGQTIDKAVVDLGKSESTAGLTFVCLSRAKRLVNLLIEPMSFERLSKLGDKPTFQLRLRGEVRLRASTGETLHPRGGVA